MTEPKLIDHPLVKCHLSVLRDKRTGCSEFRNSIRRLSTLLAYAATADLETVVVPIETPVQATDGHKLAKRIGLVPILRAGIGMVEPMLDLIPTSEVWHLGMYRDEETAQPVHYYSKLNEAEAVDTAFVLDPMLATGGSACLAIESLKQWGVPEIKMLAIIAAPEGISKVSNEFPDVEIYSCSVDECLNNNKFIVPGLGDAGDRIFNTVGN